MKKPLIKDTYNSLEDDVLNEFYNPALLYFTNYDRASAYFDSNILRLYSKGLSNIVKNNGRIRFIFSHDLNENDFRLMTTGYENREEYENIITDSLLNKLILLEDSVDISNLAYLITKGFVDIKIAITKRGIFHEKFGIFYNETDSVLFRGSNNETVAALESNYDGFETTTSWSGHNVKIIDIRRREFEDLWNDNKDNVDVIEIPNLVKKRIVSFDKGKIIIEENLNDSIILDYQDKFFMKNNLNIKEKLDINSYDFRSIKYYIRHINNDFIYFKDENNYRIILNIVNRFKDFCLNNDLRIIVSDKLQNFIEIRSYEIERYSSLGKVIKNGHFNNYENLNNVFEEFNLIVDRNLSRNLRQPQRLGSFHISRMIKSANFSVPGSGKTSIVYGAFAYLSDIDISEVDKIVMIGPLNSFTPWIEEFKLNFGEKRDLNYFNVNDSLDYNRDLIYNTKNSNLILINYEKLPSLKTETIDAIADEKTLLVFDEIHRIKNPDGVRVDNALNFAKKVKYKVTLTGTPIPNGYQDIYNILNLLFLDEYNDYFDFSPEYLSRANKSANDANIINEKIYPFFLRTTKSDLSIPKPNNDIMVLNDINQDENRLFEIIYRYFNGNIFLLYIRLLQGTLLPSSILQSIEYDENFKEMFMYDNEFIINKNRNFGMKEEEVSFIKTFGHTRKFTNGINLIKKLVLEGKQVIVWCVFRNTIEEVKKVLDSINIKSDFIYGSTNNDERDKIIQSFKNENINVLISNPHTIGEAISLHTVCHDAIYFEFTFNLTHMLQSRDRINRLGLEQGQYTQYYYLVTNDNESEFNTIDLKTYNRLKEKEELMINAVEGDQLIHVSQSSIIDDLEYILNKK